MRKFRVKQAFHSVYMSGTEGQVVNEHSLDDFTIDNWVQNGLIEEIKDKTPRKKVVVDVDKD